MAQQTGLFMIRLFVLFLIKSQDPCVECQSTNAVVMPFSCTNNDTQYLYDNVTHSLWNKAVRPVANSSDFLTVKLGLTISGILGVNEKDQVLTLFITTTLDWVVPFLRWNEISCGTNAISYPKSELWLPDIMIEEFMNEDKSPDIPYLQLNNTGGVHLVQLKRVAASCYIDIYAFPFDFQDCSLTFHSYIHEEAEMKLISKSTNFIVSSSVQYDSGWELSDVTQITTTYNLTSKRRFSALQYTITLKRHSSLYVVNLLVPSCCLSLLDLFSFFLPPENADRSAFKMTLILGYTVFLLITNDLLPDSADTTPLINVFFALSMALMVASLLFTLLVVNLSSNTHHYHRVPRWLRSLVLHYLARLLCMSPKRPAAPVILNPHAKVTADTLGEAMMPSEAGEMTKMEGAAVVAELKKVARDVLTIRRRMEEHLRLNQDDDDWKLIANVIDHLLFLFYIVFLIASYTTITAIWASY